ncbi:hypothetical protein RFI_32311, partial [Reticulomyxa filosa]
ILLAWKIVNRTYIHGAEANIPIAEPDQHPHFNKPPMQISKLPHPVKSPFEKWCEPTQEEIVASLDNNTIVIFVDGSTKPEPGIGGVGLNDITICIDYFKGLNKGVKKFKELFEL